MIVNRINADAQATIPPEILDELGLTPGDEVGFDIIGGRVVLTRPDGGFSDEHDETLETLTGLDTATVKALVDKALDDPRPSIPAEEVFTGLRARHEERVLRGR